MSHDIINELINLMRQEVLDEVKSPNPSWYAIIADEATDVSNNEQFNISIRWVNNEYTISEEPIGLVQLPDTFANTLVSAIKDVLRRCNQIQAKVPSAIPIHCLAHCVEVVLQEARRKCRSLREALELVKEIVKLVKLSPKRSALSAKFGEL